METNLKNAISAMRMKIAEMEKEQKNNKNQRKTVRIVGERTKPAWEATVDAMALTEELRIWYATYGILRGKKFDVTENNAKPLEHDRDKYYSYPDGLKGQHYTNYPWLHGKHPLCQYLNRIGSILEDFDFKFKNYEEYKDPWGYTIKTPSIDNYEEIIYTGEQEA